jgi:hypothetical protein
MVFRAQLETAIAGSLTRIGSLFVPLLCGAVLALALWSLGFQTINSDGYYYLTAARNVVETGTFTYDTIHTTNGFHWAWMGLLVGGSALLRLLGFALEGPVLVSVTVVLSCTFYVAAARQLVYLLAQTGQQREVSQIAPLLAGLVFLEPTLITLSINGLETSLFLFLLLRLIRLLSEDRPQDAMLACMALTLVRIEGIVMAPFVIMSAHSGWSSRLRRSVLVLVPVMVILALNYLADGSVLSNSSQAKAFWAALARERYLWDVPASARLILIAKDLIYLPGILFQLLLSIRDDRVLGKIVVVLLGVVSYVAVTRPSVVLERLLSRPMYLLTWYSVVTWCAYKTLYFTPRSGQFVAEFAVKDYQSIWYFAPFSLLMALAFYLILSSSGRTLVTRSALGMCLVVILWIRALSSLPQRPGIETAAACQPPPHGVTYVAQNDDAFAYWYRLPVVVLDGLVTGRRLSDGVPYLSALRGQDIERYLADLSPRFIRVGTDQVLLNLRMADERIDAIRARPVVHLCGMGEWYDLASN